MRPVPRSRHFIAVLLLAALAAGAGLLARHDDRMSDPQHHGAAAAMKRADLSLYSHDMIFGSRLWLLNPPLPQFLLNRLWSITGGADPARPFCLAVAPLVLLYLLGMYFLLYSQTRSWSISVFVAALSSTVTHALGGSFWGIGSLASIQPMGLCTVAIPWLVLGALNLPRQWAVAGIFGFVGLLGNIHPGMALNLTLVLAAAMLARWRFRPLAWLRIAICLAAAVAAALPYLMYVARMIGRIRPDSAAVQAGAYFRALEVAGVESLYPQILGEAVNWPMAMFLLVVPAALLLHRVERYPIRNAAFWWWMLGGTLVVTFLAQGLAQLVGTLRPSIPPVLSFAQASALLMLPLYVLLAHVLTSVFRIAQSHGDLIRWACLALAATWVIPSENFRVARYRALETATTFMPESSKPRKVFQHRRKTRQSRELVRLGHWARTTDPASVFLFNDIEFRVHSRRAVLAATDDLPYVYYYAPWRLSGWTQTLQDQQNLLSPAETFEIDRLRGFVRDLSRQPAWQGVRQWYVVYGGPAPPGTPLEVEPVFRGEFYRVYAVDDLPRVRSTTPATQSETFPEPETAPSATSRTRTAAAATGPGPATRKESP
jgi:hypothetical protein